MEKGMEEGRVREKLENARSLKNNGIPIDLISKSLNLSIEEIEKM
jgi:predicted transposase/invertase (TIGR01784 family)